MTPEQALEILNQASAGALLNRRDHNRVIEALEVLQEIISSQPAEAKPTISSKDHSKGNE